MGAPRKNSAILPGHNRRLSVLLQADTHVSRFVPIDEPKAKCTLSQVIAALAVSLGSLVVGFSSGYTSPALPSMKDPTQINFEVTEYSVSLEKKIKSMDLLCCFDSTYILHTKYFYMSMKKINLNLEK